MFTYLVVTRVDGEAFLAKPTTKSQVRMGKVGKEAREVRVDEIIEDLEGTRDFRLYY